MIDNERLQHYKQTGRIVWSKLYDEIMTMHTIGAFEAKTHLPQLLERVARGESLTITKHGKPVARLVPVDSSRKQAREAAARIIERRQNIERVPLQQLLATVHEGHRY